MTEKGWERPISYLLHLLCSNDRIVLADLQLGKSLIVKRTLMHVRVAMHTAEVTATAAVKTWPHVLRHTCKDQTTTKHACNENDFTC